ncbi:MAG TPA: hypothetical protein VNW46_14690, partial [Gemmatimonadaceae bacterium]|nr:hypothetical protein [Gemmatimonadaceae bacterium]
MMPSTIEDVLARVRRIGARVVHARDVWSPRLRIGVAIDRATVRAVGVRLGRVVWGLETPRVEADDITDAVVACLDSRPDRRSWLARLVAPTV